MNRIVPPSINFGVIGLGQCGGNLMEEFYLKGYPCVCLNSSHTDLRAARIPPEKQLYVGLKGRDGAGQDMELGRLYLEQNAKKTLEIASQELVNTEHIIITAGLGGGTGSNVGVLAKIIDDLDKPITAICSIPWNGEGSITKINAMQGLDQLIHSPVKSIILIDNQKIHQQLPDTKLGDYYHSANRFLVEMFDRINRISRNPLYNPIRGFDSEDLRKILLTRGIMLFGEVKLSMEDMKAGETLLARLREVWDQGGLLTSGFDFSQATVAAAILLAREDNLQEASTADFENFTAGIKEIVSSSGIYSGIFSIPEDDMRLYTILAGLPLPDRIEGVLDQAKTEGRMLSVKISHGLPELDLKGMEGMDIFSSEMTRGLRFPEKTKAENGDDSGEIKLRPWENPGGE